MEIEVLLLITNYLYFIIMLLSFLTALLLVAVVAYLIIPVILQYSRY